MPPAAQILLSPAELSYLHSSLSLSPPIRPDGRSPTQFRPLVAESDILPSTNGSARVCFSDGTEAIVGVKAEVEKSDLRQAVGEHDLHLSVQPSAIDIDDDEEGDDAPKGSGESSWVEMSIEVPGYRDDDTLPVFLSAMLTEALLASGELKDRLWINRRFHWKLYIDVGNLESISYEKN
jgi:exosome complex component RRP42